MCQGCAIFANNKKALYAKKTVSHSDGAKELRINEDKYRKFEYLWWKKELNQVHYDEVAKNILAKVDIEKATKLSSELVKKNLKSQAQLAKWLKGVPEEWDKLLDPKFKSLAMKVSPKLLTYQDKIKSFKYSDKKFNPYQATKLPPVEEIKKAIPVKVRNQVWSQVWSQVRSQVWSQVWSQVGSQVWSQVGGQVWSQVGGQVRSQVGDQVWSQVWGQVGGQVGGQVWGQVRSQVGGQVGGQVWSQVWAVSYWGIKTQLGLSIKHWFFDFLKLGIMIVFVKGKAKVFGKKGKFLGEYDIKEFK